MKKYVFGEATERVRALKQRFLSCKPTMSSWRAKVYTQTYRAYENLPLCQRRALAFYKTLETLPIFLEDGDLLAGHPSACPRGAEVFPELSLTFLPELDTFETRAYNRLAVSEDTKRDLRELAAFWRGRHPTDLFQALRTRQMTSAIDGGLLSNGHEWSGLGHVAPDFAKLLRQGTSGVRGEVLAAQEALEVSTPDFFRKRSFYQACLKCLDALELYAGRYRRLALATARGCAEPARRLELERLAAVLARVPRQSATTFYEAVQSLWLLEVSAQIESNGYSVTPGRLDQYLYPYYRADLDAGRATKAQCQELLDLLFLKMCLVMRTDSTRSAEINAGYSVGENVAISGVTPDGDDATNELSFMCLEANIHINLNQPNLTARLHANTSDVFYDAVIRCIAHGNGMPQVLNDELIVPALVRRGMPLSLARDYIPIGCDEIAVEGMWGRCNGGYLNFAKLVELTMHGGRDILYEEPCGLPRADPPPTFAEFMREFRRQLAHGVRLQAAEANLTDYVHALTQPLPLISAFLGGCIASGRDCSDGGAVYNTTGIVGVGSASAGDALMAVKRLVYEEKSLSLEALYRILKANFAGNEPLRQRMMNKIPKFGNDIDEVDELVADLTRAFFDETDRYTNQRGGAFWPSLYSVTAQIGLGNSTAASADGRLAEQPLSDGLTPMYGMDRSGPTAALCSFTKIDLGRSINGVIVNQRLAPTVLKSAGGIAKMTALLKSFVQMKGFHWQFNVISTQTLLDAQARPEHYRDLTVRVAGYSAIFTELSQKAQQSIIQRYAAEL